MSNYHDSNKRIAKNTAFLYVRMLFVLLVNLYVSRVLLDALGVTDYGIYVVVTGFVTLFGFVNATLASTMQRYYNYTGTQDAVNGIRNVYSTGCYIHVLIALVALLLMETVGLWYMYRFIVIPAERFEAGLFLFQTSALTLVLIILQIPFMGLVIAKERMGFFALVSIIDVVLKLAAALSLEVLPYDSVKTYGLLLLCISILNLTLYVAYVKYNFAQAHLSRQINRDLLRALMSFAGWNLVGTFAFMLKGQGVSLLLNNFFGPLVNAARGIAMQVSSAINGFSNNITVAFTPQIVNSVAAGDDDRARSMMYNESRICFGLILLIMIPLSLEIDYILRLWLGINVPDKTGIFSILMLADTTLCTLNTPCTQITQATGRIRKYQIAATCVNLALIPVCYVFLKIGMSAVSSFIITIIFSAVNQVVCLYNTNRVFRLNIPCYLRSVVRPCLICLVLLPVLPALVRVSLSPSIGRLVTTTVIDILAGLPLIYFILFNRKQRQTIRNYIADKLKERRIGI
jgi:O-antigen/teichoic acid export membrane protein